MVKVLIVEDEMLVRIGIKNSIEWEKLGMKLIADVPNGQAALEAYHKFKPDLILTDIKMPIMDGIELIRCIRVNDSKTKIIVLTCHEEFDLLHKTMKLGVSDYILKHKIVPTEMETVLKKVLMELQSHPKAESNANNIKVDTSTVKETAIKQYMFYHIITDEDFSDIIKKLNLRITNNRLLLCIMDIQKYEKLQEKFSDKQGDLIRFAVLNIIEELLNGYHRGEVIHKKDERYLLLFSFEDIVSEHKIYQCLNEITTRISSVMELYMDTTVVFGTSHAYHEYSFLPIMYKEGKNALSKSYFVSDLKCIHADQIGDQKIIEVLNDKLVEILKADTILRHTDYKQEIENGIKELLIACSINKASVQRLFIHWLHWHVKNINISSNTVYHIALEFAQKSNECTTIDENIAVFLEYLDQIDRHTQASLCLSKEIAGAVNYIKKNYHHDISLTQLAEIVQISPSYLSSQFKKELGLSFVDYMNKVRIDEAKEILANTYFKSYEVAEQVGFSDESYFSRMFKRYTGMRPNEFRKKRL